MWRRSSLLRTKGSEPGNEAWQSALKGDEAGGCVARKKEEILKTGILEFFVNRSRRVVWLLKLPHCLLINTVLELRNQDYIEEC